MLSKFMKKLRTNEAKNLQKIKNLSSTQNFLVLITKSVLRQNVELIKSRLVQKDMQKKKKTRHNGNLHCDIAITSLVVKQQSRSFRRKFMSIVDYVTASVSLHSLSLAFTNSITLLQRSLRTFSNFSFF